MIEKVLTQPIPDGELSDNIDGHDLEIPEAIGATATQAAGAEADGLSAEQRTFQDRIGDFLNPDVHLDVDEQLATMTEFWGMLTGHKLPELDSEAREDLAEAIAAHPDRRVVPTPLLDLAGRKELAEKAREFAKSGFTTEFDALWAPDESQVYGRLLRDPEGVVEEKGKFYSLRYKLPDSKLTANRTDFIQTLIEDEQAMLAEDSTPWVFPVMDVSVRSSRTYQKAADMFKGAEATVTPESLIAMQLIHQANGTPNTKLEADFANEAVYMLDRDGNPKKLVGVTYVSWNTRSKQVSLSSFDANMKGAGVTSVRMAESGL